MLELNPYAPPGFGAQLERTGPEAALLGPADPESVRRANLPAERRLMVIAGVGYVIGLAIVLWAVAVVIDDEMRGLIPATILLVIGVASVAGAYWLSCRRAAGRWCATALCTLCALLLAPAAWTAFEFEPRYWPLGLALVVPIALLCGLWWPGGGGVLTELYRRTVISRTPYLEPRAALPVGVLVGLTVVGYVVSFGLRL